MSTRISVALDIINTVKALDGRFQVNQHQCKRLVSFYNRAGLFFDQLREYFSDEDHQRLYSLPSLDVTISVLQKGQLLVTKYTDENWFEGTVTAGVNQDSFVAIHGELGACIRSIHDSVAGQGLPSKMLPDVGKVAPLLFLDEDDRASLFERDAEKDMKGMLQKIESRKIEVSVGRKTKLTTVQKESELRSLDMASAKICETDDAQGRPEDLSSYLRIESSQIEVLGRIGSGGSATVHRCRWLNLDFAVKIFGRGDVEGLRREVHHLSKLRHPNIVALEGVSIREKDGRPMVVMELMDCDLYAFLIDDHYDIPLSKAVGFIYQIATGMEYLHKNKLFHGDLKGKNVLIKRHSADNNLNHQVELKISDFGLSIMMERPVGYEGNDSDCTSLGNKNVGTTRWRAPEAFDVTDHELKRYSMKADVYSFAMTCVEILSKDVPYANVDLRSIKRHVWTGNRPTLPSSIPEDLSNLIVRCWDTNPSLRPGFSQICKELQGLKEFVEEVGSVPLPLSEDMMPDEEDASDKGVFSKLFRFCLTLHNLLIILLQTLLFGLVLHLGLMCVKVMILRRM